MLLKNLLLLRSFLYLFQVEEYVVGRFLKVIIKKPFPLNVEKVKSLEWTFKAKIIFLASILLFLIQNVAFVFRGLSWEFFAGGLAVFLLFPWIYLILAYYLLIPREVINRGILIKKCAEKITILKNKGLKVFGITGSYGKTSTKVFVTKMLENKYKTYATPKSFNTLFGIAQAKFKASFVTSVLEYLNEKLELFIVEMGAYKIGEIDELCRAFPPDFGLLTGITTMHYEKFGSLENTIKAKSELIEGLPAGGKLFLNISNKHVRRINNELEKQRRLNVISYGYEEDAKYRAKIEEMTKDGTRFRVFYPDGDMEYETKLIGTGNILNILASIAVGFEFEIPKESIQKTISELKPVEARMEVIDNGSGIITINNGYSSNPESFKQTLETLKLFETNYKILVTPGIFELGEITYDVHKALGALLDESVDMVILLGREEDNDRLRGLRDGLKQAKYPQDQIKFINRIEQCYDLVVSRGMLPSVVVLENDLPDIYNI